MKKLKSLRSLLIIWYIGSLIVLSVFFYLVVHILQLHNGTTYFVELFLILALIGLIIIFRITRSLRILSDRIKSISSKNLNERITGISGENEIGDLADSFNNLMDRLDDAFRQERQFIADVAHELKTPVATLQSGIEIALSKDRTKQEYEDALKEALIDAQRQSKTLNNVLDLAWSEASYGHTKPTALNLSDLLEELEDIVYKLARIKEITVEKSIKPNVFIAGYGTKDKLARALLNIFDNAIKYTLSKGKITIKLTVERNNAIIKVTDTGIGITAKDIPHIFERFYRGSEAIKTAGTGLGLAITQSIIQAHHGKIQIKSQAEKRGTTVSIFFTVI